MKTVISIVLSVLIPLLLFSSHPDPVYTEGDQLTVAATSGLRLRMLPDQHAATIRVIPFADSVTIESTFDFDAEHEDQLGWFDGHWVKVRYKGTAGYVFDAYLSRLSPPDHENQLCFRASGMLTALDTYFADHHLVLCIEEGPEHNEYVHQIVTLFDSGIESTKTKGDGWFTIEYSMEGYRLSEVLNLMRQMIVGDELRNAFESGMTFHTNRNGKLAKIAIQFGDANPITIEKVDEYIIVKSTLLESIASS